MIIVIFSLFNAYVNGQITEISRDSRIFTFVVNASLSYPGYELQNHPVNTFSTKFLVTQCAMECHRSPKCRSFNFSKKKRICQLNDATHLQFPDDFTNSTVSDMEYHTKDAISISAEAIGPCGSYPCRNDGRCLDTVSAKTNERTYLCLCKSGWTGHHCDLREDTLSWATWGEWSPCSTSCGHGYNVRHRKCLNQQTGQVLSARQCYGRDIEYKACAFRKCPIWDTWGEWDVCSTYHTCGRGFQTRQRQCLYGGKPGKDRYCLGPTNETMACDGVKCNGMVRLRDGTEFGEGRVEIHHSISNEWLQVCAENWNKSLADIVCRQRGFLGAFTVENNGTYETDANKDIIELQCNGRESNIHECKRVTSVNCSISAGVQCMVRGAWSLWSSWGTCSVSCENGTRTRTRACNHPPPNFGGIKCPGNDTEYKPCTLKMCPVDGVWNAWSVWSECSVSCANGTKFRTRTCEGPFHGGQKCEGKTKDVTGCFPKMCPVDGVWQPWSIWSTCTVSCGYGTRQRSRSCTGPFYDGLNCTGEYDEEEACNTFSCPVDGSWKSWTEWDECSVSCGGGIQNRTRDCNNALHGGTDCIGPSEQSRTCNSHPCPVDAYWEDWSTWSDCSVTCANGTQWRNRTCVEALHGGKNCTGNEEEERVCTAAECPVDGVWQAWSDWEACNVTCGGGEQARRRKCIGPYFSGAPCPGLDEERRPCNIQMCPVDGIWEAWSNWTECSLDCGSGEQSRFRECIGPFHGGAECPGDGNETRLCNTHSCAVHGYWYEWSNWTSCNVSCGGGSTWRRRRCEEPLFGGDNCTGPAMEIKPCNTHHCPVDGIFEEWSKWSDCSLSCGNGSQSRGRGCIGPFYDGRPCDGEFDQERDCNTHFCPVDGVWENWSNWTSCSKSCGRGTQTRQRVCDGPFYGGAECQGEESQTKYCIPSECPVDGLWNPWTQWSNCSVTCGKGEQTRDRTCDGPFYGGQNCTGPDTETKECYPMECPVDGLFMEWAQWSDCPVTCGGSTRYRERECIGPFFGGEDCKGAKNETETCADLPCPVDGEWSLWSMWSGCTLSCGTGQSRRYRYCSENAHGGRNCSGNSEEYQDCNDFPCPVDGVFLPWSEWGECSETCGTGEQWRNRSCDGPYHGGSDCDGNVTEVRNCNTHNCPVDGIFLNWSNWTECSVSCGGGSRSRSRECDGPYYGGRSCEGNYEDIEDCNMHECPIDGVWKTWGEWDPCNVTCGGGMQFRNRSCHGPFFGGLECNGSESDSQICNVQPCPVDGVWLSWSSWGVCDVTCGGGIQLRNRSCDGPYHGGHDCMGNATELQFCNNFSCPIDGVWNGWSEWDNCSEPCGGGNQSRYRTCDGPYYGGANCSGEDMQTQECNTHFCPVDGVFGNWSEWFDCNVTCGGGTQWRERLCEGPFYGGNPCDGPFNESRSCNEHNCPVDGVWLSWGEWDACNVTCGGGMQKRNRTCEGPFYGGANCTGPEDDYQDCNTHPCPVDGVWEEWEDWGPCDVSCGGGIQFRYRQCFGPFYGGQNCSGSAEDERQCNTHNCPVDGKFTQWSGWGLCSVTCGGGIQLRNRSCDGPFYGGKNCSGDWESSQICNTLHCPATATGWTSWSSWYPCSVSCNGGIRFRKRECQGASKCPGGQYSIQQCNTQRCTAASVSRVHRTVDGVWDDWSPWGNCSVSCGGGFQFRNRTCIGPFHGGSNCDGQTLEDRVCGTAPCPIPGEWLSWGSWSRCSVTCDTGLRWRTRECNMTSYGTLTAPCLGSYNGTEECNTFSCRPFAKTCSELASWGMVDSGQVQLGPKRRDNWMWLPELEPVWLYCDMESENGTGVTVIGHDQEKRQQVMGHEGAGQYLVVINYNISVDHVIAIIDYSKNCKQFLRWECLRTVIHNPHAPDSWTTFWTNRSSAFFNYQNPAGYFPGAKPGSGNCACGDTGTCADPSQRCNCDMNDGTWRSDEGYLTYKEDMPILAFRAGDTGEEPKEQGAYTIGPVICKDVVTKSDFSLQALEYQKNCEM